MAKKSLEEYMAKYSGVRKRTRNKDDISEKQTIDKNTKIENTILTETKNSNDIKEIKNGKWLNVETQSTVDFLNDEKNDEKNELIEKPLQKKRKGGLQSQSVIENELLEKEKKFQNDLNELKKLGADKNTTIYRDSKGRKIDKPTNLLISKNDRELLSEERKKKIKEFNKNEAEIEENVNFINRIKEMKNEGVNVYENDSKHIESQKNEIKSEDPALMFNKKVIDKHKQATDKKFVSITGRKLYKEVRKYPMNRFDVKPGWRWDGIVRGNGFEQRWHEFQVNKK